MTMPLQQALAAPVRYYVVGAPVNGHPEYLYQVAVKTLGNGKRYREIFDLNKDRPQPDGGRLSDPMVGLRPGWILMLPADANGSGVRVGTPPKGAEPTVPSAPNRESTPTPAISVGPVSPEFRPPADARPKSTGISTMLGFRIGALALMVLLLAGALVVLRNRRALRGSNKVVRRVGR
jgi:hypothetical protein